MITPNGFKHFLTNFQNLLNIPSNLYKVYISTHFTQNLCEILTQLIRDYIFNKFHG